MNVLILSQFFSTTKGGGEYVFSLIAKKLSENNHKIFVITNNVIGEEYTEHKNLKIITVPPKIKYQGGIPPSFIENFGYFYNAVKEGLKTVKSHNIEIIHSNNFAPALAGSFISQIKSVPHITTVHDVFSLCGRDYWKKWGSQTNVSKLNVMLAPMFEKFMIRLKHNCVHTVSNATKNDLLKFGEKKPIYVIPNSIYDDGPLNRNVNPGEFVYVGRLVFYKNLEIIIKAISKVKNSYNSVKLIIVGDGPYKKNLLELIAKLNLNDNVELKGHLQEKEKKEKISQSNALLFPSLCEGFGLVILEAFAQKRPVIVSNLPPMSDIVNHEKTGYVLDPSDDSLWAKYILNLINNPAQANHIGSNGFEELKIKFNQEIMYDKLIKMYNDIITKS